MQVTDGLPYLTTDVPGIGGVIKAVDEDFVVEEMPLYPASGQGTHIYFRLRKTGIATMPLVHQIARNLGVPHYYIGYAGLKDAHAVTIQTFSVEHIDPARIEGLQIPGVEVLEVARHNNKLRLGHLAGNRFTIRIRDAMVDRLPDVQALLTRAERRGLPNYFGPQRFGMRGDTWMVGQAILNGDYDSALAQMLGRVGPADYGDVAEARRLYDQGNYAAAADAWPHAFHNERRACRFMAQTKGKAAKAFKSLDKNLQRFMVSAYQSYLFNQVLTLRINELDQLWLGDLAWRHPQGAVFPVEDLEKELPRCQTFEISPTGPIYGNRMRSPNGRQLDIENAVMTQAGVTGEHWETAIGKTTAGGRRPLRLCPYGAQAAAASDARGPYIELSFWLESGCYATSVVREICKSDTVAAGPLVDD